MGTVGLTVALFFGMALAGVQLVGAVTMPIAGALIARVVDPEDLAVAGSFAFQVIVAVATFFIGMFALGLPWVACSIAAVLIFLTSYARPAGY